MLVFIKNPFYKVSFETTDEWNFVRAMMARAGVTEIWTAGRLCDAEVSSYGWNYFYS